MCVFPLYKGLNLRRHFCAQLSFLGTLSLGSLSLSSAPQRARLLFRFSSHLDPSLVFSRLVSFRPRSFHPPLVFSLYII